MSKRNGRVGAAQPTYIEAGDLKYFLRLKAEAGLLPAIGQKIAELQATYQKIESSFNHFGEYLAETYGLDPSQDLIGDDGEILRPANQAPQGVPAAGRLVRVPDADVLDSREP